jgi:hypothetical protein
VTVGVAAYVAPTAFIAGPAARRPDRFRHDAKRTQQVGQFALRELTRRAIIMRAAPSPVSASTRAKLAMRSTPCAWNTVRVSTSAHALRQSPGRRPRYWRSRRFAVSEIVGDGE